MSRFRIPFRDMEEHNEALREELLRAFENVIGCHDYLGADDPLAVRSFEAALAEYVGVRHAVAVSSGTAAIELALRSVGLGVDDEVLTVPNTFVATAAPAALIGSHPVMAPIDIATGLLDVDQLDDWVTPRTRAVVPVHLYGAPVDVGLLSDWATRRGLALIEDCAHAIGARWEGRHVGTFGDLGCFSFYAGKNLGAIGEGGAVVTNDDDLAHAVRARRNHGGPGTQAGTVVGHNLRMGALEAASLSVKLPWLDRWNATRRVVSKRYDRGFAGTSFSVVPSPPGEIVHARHLYVVRHPSRDQAISKLWAIGVDARIHYPLPVFRLPAFREYTPPSPYRDQADYWASTVLSLPLSAAVTDSVVDEVTTVLEATAQLTSPTTKVGG